ncbi:MULTISPECIES: caspase, EACC1-associated type [Actinoalloteichus]|uniref:Caspase domain-containing protein n=1 Tax=Actinoalloteichus fjordicus TaxID=1612552 RepID=A0AAC9LEC6_9PSEU|nr:MULTISPECIES: AAA domain-containing protein [Actinoalloteichus]APU16303.1 Caspase domain-containing protein [Actinoalloteichus fjordicus]APU22362.1 Caspase domain-containing protein [Actinoalloteichus sp. GBA129-24]
MSGPPRRHALLIGTELHSSPDFAPLPSARADVEQLAPLLEHPAIGAFDSVRVLLDASAPEMRRTIEDFLGPLGPDDLALLYISGHGVRTTAQGEFHFVAADTEPGDLLTITSVGASYVNDHLQLCRARQKVAILDCCHSGGFALDFATSHAKSQRGSPLTSRAVYILSSSDATEASFQGRSDAGRVLPSVFTGKILDALRSGSADFDGDGRVTVDELRRWVDEQMRGVVPVQTPMTSTLHVNGVIEFAKAYRGPALAPAPPLPRGSARRSATGAGKTRGEPDEGSGKKLLEYYQDCLALSEVEPDLLRVDQVGSRSVCLTGAERILTGRLDEDEMIPLSSAAADLVAKAGERDKLWYGYPAVALLRSRDGRALRPPMFAPLFIREVEVVPSDAGLRLKPSGPVLPHRGLAEAVLGAEDADRLLDTYRPTWQPGMESQLVKDIRHHLMHDFELECVQELRPGHLDPRIDLRVPSDGARNAAVLYLQRTEWDPNSRLYKDLAQLGPVPKIAGTALGALWPDVAQPPVAAAPFTGDVVAPKPLNGAQRRVLEAAMSRQLTVATGPPGTGKTQLVVNVVATALANGEKVLVASSNNTAVDEVADGCKELVSDSIVRTGSQEKRRCEQQSLTALASLERGATSTATARAELRRASAHLAEVIGELGAKAAAEQGLLTLSMRRRKLLDRLEIDVPALSSLLDAVARPQQWAVRARQAAGARWFAGLRRRRVLRALGWRGEATASTCELLAEVVEVELRLRTAREQATTFAEDDSLATEAACREDAVRTASRELLAAVVATDAVTGRRQIQDLLQTVASGERSDWSQVAQLVEHVRGWAVTALSARRFPTEAGLFDLVIIDEASQCSIPAVLPLLFRARRALVIGDAMQLKPVTTLKAGTEADIRRAVGLRSSWLDERKLAYHRYSAFAALERAAGGALLLDEHYRCHPVIAELINTRFYRGGLDVRTDVRRLRGLADRRAVIWADAPGEPSRSAGGSWQNRAESSMVERSVDYLLRRLPPEATIGVVTPFAGQTALLKKQLTAYSRVRVGTVHTFQGGECDVIVFSLVAGPLMKSTTTAWLEAEHTLWNVAISRAKANLLVVGDRSFWRDRPGIAAELSAVAESDQSGGTPDESLDDLMQLMYERLRSEPGTPRLRQVLGGYPVDAEVVRDGGSIAVALDRGHGPEAAADHLQAGLARLALLTDAEQGRTAVRLPAWRLFDDRPVL